MEGQCEAIQSVYKFEPFPFDDEEKYEEEQERKLSVWIQDLKSHQDSCPEGNRCTYSKALSRLIRQYRLDPDFFNDTRINLVWKSGFKRFYNV